MITYIDEEFEVLEDGWAVRQLLSYGEGCLKVLVHEIRSPAGATQRIGAYCCHGHGLPRPPVQLYPERTP